ncbi:hypothetical protein D3C80_1573560 [compost metagenome]
MPQTHRFFLADIVDFHFRGTLNLFEQLQLSILQQSGFQLERIVKVILDRPLALTGNDDNVLNAGSDGFFHDILDGRLVDNRKHFLRHGLCRRKEARS